MAVLHFYFFDNLKNTLSETAEELTTNCHVDVRYDFRYMISHSEKGGNICAIYDTERMADPYMYM